MASLLSSMLSDARLEGLIEDRVSELSYEIEKLTLSEVEHKLGKILDPISLRKTIIQLLSEFFDVEIRRRHK